MLNKREPLPEADRRKARWLSPYLAFDNYQQVAASTAIYPKKARTFYPAMGLGGEAGEILNKIKKVLRDRASIDKDDLKKELGDCLWYIALIADDEGIPLSEVALANVVKLLDRQERGVIGGSGDNR